MERRCTGKNSCLGALTLRDYDGQVAEVASGTSANKMTKAVCSKACVLPENTTSLYGETYPKSDLFNKAILMT